MGDDERKRFDEARKRSVDNLQRLYTVVVSLAVTEMLRRVLEVGSSTAAPDFAAIPRSNWLMLSSFLFTIVPFYHGANRYLDATYVTSEQSAKHFALLLDFIILFLEGVAFFVLAVSIGSPRSFYTILGCLFLADAIWVWLTLNIWSVGDTAHVGGLAKTNYGTWLIINIAVGSFVLLSVWSNLWPDSARVPSLAVVVILRTLLDYATVWDFYYPKAVPKVGNVPPPVSVPPPAPTAPTQSSS
jgi:hypothetical protein